MKFEFDIPDKSLVELAERVRGLIFEDLKGIVKGVKLDDVASASGLMSAPGWSPFVLSRLSEAVTDLVEDGDATFPIFSSDICEPFAPQIAQAHERARARSEAKKRSLDKTLKLSAKNLPAAKKILRANGIEFE